MIWLNLLMKIYRMSFLYLQLVIKKYKTSIKNFINLVVNEEKQKLMRNVNLKF